MADRTEYRALALEALADSQDLPETSTTRKLSRAVIALLDEKAVPVPVPVRAELEPKHPPTIQELRDLQAELDYQAGNQNEPLFTRAREVIDWFIDDYLRSVPNGDDRNARGL